MSLEGVKFKITGGAQRPAQAPRPITMVQAIQHVKSLGLDSEVEKIVLNKVSRYPANTFEVVLKNLPSIIDQIKLQLKKESHERSYKPQEIKHQEDGSPAPPEG